MGALGGGGEPQRVPTESFTSGSGFGVDVARELLGVPGNLNINDRFQADEFFDPVTGQSLNQPSVRFSQLLNAPLDEFGSDIDAFDVQAQRLAGLSEAGLFEPGALSDFVSGLLDFGEGGLIPRTIAAAFEPAERRGRQNIIAEGTRRGLLTTAGGRSTDVDRAFGEFQADLAAKKAAAVPSFLTQFLNVPAFQGNLANQAAGLRGSALPFQQALAGARVSAAEAPFNMQERQFARDLQRLGLIAPLAGLERQGTTVAAGQPSQGFLPPLLNFAGPAVGGAFAGAGQAGGFGNLFGFG